MGKQVKGWTPPEDAVEETTPTEPAWTPPADAIVEEPVKKKESPSLGVFDFKERLRQPFEQPGDAAPSTSSSKPSEKSTPKKAASSKDVSFIAALKSMVDSYNQPADPSDARPDHFVNAVKRGLNLAEQANIVGPFAGKPDAEALKKVTDLQKEHQTLSGSDSYTKFTQSKTFGDALSTFAKDPARVVVELAGESLAGMAKYGWPRIAAGAGTGATLGSVVPGIGTASGAAGGAVVGMADTSYGLEFTGKFLESLQEAGVDLKDPKSLEKAFADDAVMDKARSAANKKAIPIALFDLVSGGIAGKVVSKPAKSLLGKVAAGAAEFGVQAGMGAGGEAAGELVSGEKLQPGSIMSEAFGELASTPVEVGLGLAQMKSPAQVVQEETSKMNPSDPASVDAASEKIEESLNQKDNAVQERSTEEVLQREPSETGGSGSGRGPLEQGEQGNEVAQESAQDQNTSEEKEVDTPQQKASREIDELVAKGDVSRDGNKVTILTEEGGREVKRIYEELENSRSQESGNEQPAGGDLQQSSDTERLEESPKPKTETAQQVADQNSGQSIAEQRSESENSKVESNAPPQQNPTQQQQEQQSPDVVEQPSIDTPPSDQPSSGSSTTREAGEGGSKKYTVTKRILASDANEGIKRGIKEKGDSYVPKGINITDNEAANLLELYGNERAETLVRDSSNGITGDTRTALAAKLYESYKQTADQATDPETKRINYDKAVDIALTAAEQLKESGRQVNAAKIWKAITSNEDMTVMAIEKEQRRYGEKMIEGISKQVKKSRKQFDEQVAKLIRQKVQEGVEQQLKRAKLITPERKKSISDAFDALKIKTPKGVASATTLLPEVWNGAIEAVKRAVLAGADVANAIQAGVDYIKEKHKGDWDEKGFRDTIESSVQQMVPVDPSQINPEEIETPKLSGKKKKDFINQVVDAYNAGNLTEDKFEQLYAKGLGAREFSSEEREQIRELAKTIGEVEHFEEVVKNDFTRENIAKRKDLLAKAQIDNKKLQAYAQGPSNVWDTLISIMQAHLLAPLSFIVNIYSNIGLQNLRFLSTANASFVDYGITKLAKAGLLSEAYKNPSIDFAELQKGYFKGGWDGIIEGLKQLKTGPLNDERSLREVNTNFNPSAAIDRWKIEDRNLQQKINDYIEGTLGWSAEAHFRLLNSGDKPFRRAAEMARAMEIAKQKGLKGIDAEKFIMFPDEESAELIKKAGDAATFQQDNVPIQVVQRVLNSIINSIGDVPILGGPLKLLAKSQIPYVKTPWNIMVETLKYAAFPVTGLIGIHQIVKGNRRTGAMLVGQAIVGAMIFAVAKTLFSKGLLSWDEPYKKEGKNRERRQIQYDNIPPNALNVSALQRGLVGMGFDIKDDDTWIDYNKLGVLGLLFDNYTNQYFTNIKEEGKMPEESDFYTDLLKTAPRVASQSLDQSFLRGTNSLLNAIQDGGGYETEQWLINTAGSISSIVYPNTLSSISKASDEFIRDTRDDTFAKRLMNTYKTKFFIGEQLPPKVNLWGEKITGNPEGRSKYAYYLWDPTKFKNVDTENFKYKLYQAWKDSKFDDDYLPSIPKRDITYRKVKIPLNSQQYEKLATYIGQQRKNLASAYINSSRFESKDREKVIKKLKDIYEEGAERGKKKFLMDMGWNILTAEKLSKINKN